MSLRAATKRGVVEGEGLEVLKDHEQALRRIALPGLYEEGNSGLGEGSDRGWEQLTKIVVGGLPGSGKTTFAKLLAEKLGFRYVGTGALFRSMATERRMSLEEFSRYAEAHDEIDRMIDEEQVRQAQEGDVVVDSRLGAWMIDDADLKVCLIASLEERARRAAGRDGLEPEEARRKVAEREKSEKKRYREFYGIDVTELERFDLIVNSETFSPDQIFNIVVAALQQVKSQRSKQGS